MLQESAFCFSRHASRRAQQRGITHRRLNDALKLFDVETECGGGCYALALSNRAADSLVSEGWSAQEMDRLRRMRMVIAEDGTVLTVMHRYRQRRRPRSRPNIATPMGIR